MLKAYFGLRSDTAANGLEAYNKMRRNLTKKCCSTFYNLILMDVHMPVMDGICAAEKVLDFHQELSKTPDLEKHMQPLKIVAMTAYFDLKTVEQALATGITKIYTKPVSKNDLEEATAELLEGWNDEN